MALYRTGTAAMDAQGVITGTGTKWREPLSLIRTGATIVFLEQPVIKLAVISEIVSNTEMKAISTDGAVVPDGKYVILLNDSLTVDGMAQDVAETLRYYQSKETVIEEALEFFKNFDLEALKDLVNKVNADAQQVANDKAATEQLKNETQQIKDTAVNETNQIKADTDAIKTQTQQIKDSAITEIGEIRNDALDARDAAENAQFAAEQSNIAAGNAKQGAETARDEARQWAQQVNPENLLHKDQNLSDVPNKVEAKSNIGLGCFESLVRGDYSDSRMWNPPLSGYVFIDSNKVWGAYDPASGNRIALPVESGGTGALTLEDARKNLQVDRLHYAGTSETIVRSPNDDFYIYINKDNKNWGAWDWKAGPDGTGSNIPLPMGSGGTGRIDGNLWANPDKTVGVGMEGDTENKKLFMWRTPGNVAFGSWVHALEGQWYGANWYLGATRSGTSTIQDVRITVNDGENAGATFLFQGVASGTFRPGRGIVTQPTYGGWGLENIGTQVPFYVDTASNNNNNWNPALSCGTISTGGYYLRAAFGTITSNASSWPRAVVKLLGDNRFHRAFEFDYGGGISTWGSVQSSSDDQTWTYAYNFAKNPTSDRDLKDNIKYTDGKESYDRVMQWLPSMFTYKGSDIQRYGFIAQDLMKIDSQYVKLVPGAPKFLDVMKYNEETGEEELDRQIEYDRYDDTLSLDINVMMADLGAAFIYMNKKNKTQQEEIKELKNEVAEMKKMIEEMRSMFIQSAK